MVATASTRSTSLKTSATINDKVTDILSAIKTTSTSSDADKQTTNKLTGVTKKPKALSVPRGIAKSGRPWKEVKQKYEQQKRHATRICCI